MDSATRGRAIQRFGDSTMTSLVLQKFSSRLIGLLVGRLVSASICRYRLMDIFRRWLTSIQRLADFPLPDSSLNCRFDVERWYDSGGYWLRRLLIRRWFIQTDACPVGRLFSCLVGRCVVWCFDARIGRFYPDVSADLHMERLAVRLGGWGICRLVGSPTDTLDDTLIDSPIRFLINSRIAQEFVVVWVVASIYAELTPWLTHDWLILRFAIS